MGQTINQSFVYKGTQAELHDDDVADRMKAEEGWFDNPTDAKKPAKRVPAAKPPVVNDDAPDENAKDASGTPFDADRHYKDKRTDDDGNWAVKKNAKS